MPDNQADIDTLPPALLALLQRGMAQRPQGVRRQTLALRAVMAQYRNDPAGAEFLFGFALNQAPDSLPLYRALIKFYNRERQFDAAYDMAVLGMREAVRQGSLPPDWPDWTRELFAGKDASFAMLTLKAMAFLQLRRGNTPASVEILERLKLLDPSDGIGVSVLAALAAGI